MKKDSLVNFCIENNLLLDSTLLDIFLKYNLEEIYLLINKIKLNLNKKFINFSLIEENGEKIKKIIEEINFLNNNKLQGLILDLKLEKKIIKEKKENISYQERETTIKIISSYSNIGKFLEVKDFTKYFKNRYEFMRDFIQNKEELENLISIGKIVGDKQKFSIIGIVNSKTISKNKNIILEVEDLTGTIKVVISSTKQELYKSAEDIALDSVLGFNGVGNNQVLFTNNLIFPDTYLEKRKKSSFDENVVFIGDVHYGSKNFLEKDFINFINYLNSEDIDAKKIKYLFIVGDLITGVGNYPNQEIDLKIIDLEEQFQGIANLLNYIRKDIKIIISPGNHDCVRLMEPQPLLDEKYSWPLYELENVIVTGNPSTINIGAQEDFDGFDILLYHGFSFPYYANNVPSLMKERTMNEPEKIMKYLLKNRHLAPTHSSTQYFPSEKDGLIIRKTPDIFVSGHTHKSGVTYYNNILLISCSSWEGMTLYQEKFGNKPDHCKVPLFNLKTRVVKILDFETGEDGIKLYVEENE